MDVEPGDHVPRSEYSRMRLEEYCEEIELKCFDALGQLRKATALLRKRANEIEQLKKENQSLIERINE